MSRKNSIWTFSLILSGWLLGQSVSYASHLELRPRIETGAINYGFEMGTLSRSVAPAYGQTTGENETQDKLEFSDTMGFAGGGLTLFSGRWFLDLSFQTVFEGEDHTSGMSSQYIEYSDAVQGGVLAAAALEYAATLDHQGQAVSVGYLINKRLSVFAGYKWANTNLEMVFNGPMNIRIIDQSTSIGRLYGEEKIEFEYAGPFIGITHGWLIDGRNFWNGLISANLGVAFLSSDMQREQNSTSLIESVYNNDYPNGGTYYEPITWHDQQTESSGGETLGITFGLSWNGTTPIKGLTYSVGASAYRYQFDSDNSSLSEIRETSVNLKFGLAYLF